MISNRSMQQYFAFHCFNEKLRGGNFYTIETAKVSSMLKLLMFNALFGSRFCERRLREGFPSFQVKMCRLRIILFKMCMFLQSSSFPVPTLPSRYL